MSFALFGLKVFSLFLHFLFISNRSYIFFLILTYVSNIFFNVFILLYLNSSSFSFHFPSVKFCGPTFSLMLFFFGHPLVHSVLL